MKQKDDLPNILIISDNSLSMHHGTGVVLHKHFSAYPPKKVFNAYSVGRIPSLFPQNMNVYPHFLLKFLLKKGVNTSSGTVSNTKSFFKLRQLLDEFFHLRSAKKQIESTGFKPDIIYSVCHSFRGFNLLKNVLNNYEEDIPVVQHFFDLYFHNNEYTIKLFNELLPKITEIWSLTETMQHSLEKIIQHPIDLVRIFQCQLPNQFKENHRPFNANFSAIMIGNCWLPEVINDVINAWKALEKRIGKLPPIQWCAHPLSIERVRHSNIVLGDTIDVIGFVPKEELEKRIQEADIGILPFNRERYPENDYAKYSLPSRITEMASNGLPIFCAAGEQTETKLYIEQKKIGICSLPTNPQQFQEDLFSFAQNQDLRRKCGHNGRFLAENEFNLTKYQQWLYSKLGAIANQQVSTASC